MRELKCHLHEKRCRQAGGTLCGYLLAFPYLSFRLFRFTLSQTFLKLPLAFFAFVVGKDVGEDTPGDVLDFVLRNTGTIYWNMTMEISWIRRLPLLLPESKMNSGLSAESYSGQFKKNAKRTLVAPSIIRQVEMGKAIHGRIFRLPKGGSMLRKSADFRG